MKKVLLVKTSSLGDVIHNLPVVNDILQHVPKAEIDWVVEEGFADIPALHPAVNQIFTVAMRRWRKQLFNIATWKEISHFRRTVAAKHYDVVIDTQGLLKSALMTTFTQGIKHGHDKDSAREPVASRFYDVRHPIAKNQHAVTRNRKLVADAMGYTLADTPPDYGIEANTAINIKLTHTQAEKPWVIGLHGTSRDSKLWPTEHWQQLAVELSNQGMQLLLPWASAAEKHRAELIANSHQDVTVLPKLSIAELAAIIQQSKVAIGVDTGLSHLATALNIPTVAIYTDTQPALTGVHPGAYAAAINLGGIQQVPTVDTVLGAMQSIIE